MKNIILSILLMGFTMVAVLTGCKVDPSLDVQVTDTTIPVSFSIPQGWSQPVYSFTTNPLTQQGFALGRKLFYDVNLSGDNTVSCASCHQQFAAFSHLDHALSHGIDGLFGTRNTPGLYNLAWKPDFFWDGGVINLESQPINPIENPVEMNENINDVVRELGKDASYRQLFKKAFGDETVNSQRIFKALAQFMATMVSNNSRYDKYIRGEADANMTAQELNGLQLFRDKCSGCHKEPMFTDYSFRNNGLSIDVGLNDSGRAHITLLATDLYKFSVPSLRNVDLTRPYMHDGRFTSLDGVLEHYRTGIVSSPTLDTALKNGISMTDNEKEDIIAFLKTLSDDTFIKDSRFSEPK